MMSTSIERDVPKLSIAAAIELRRIYVKHVAETLPTPETKELVAGGYISGRYVSEPERFVVEAVTPIGKAALDTREAGD
jgi:hypothetical protein